MPRNPHKTACSIPGYRAWAVRGADPPRCTPHCHLEAAPSPRLAPISEPFLRASDEPAQGRGEGPLLSASERPSPRRVGAPPGNQNRLVHGFYASALQPAEQADLADPNADLTLDAEIAIVRVALRRILVMLLTGLTLGPAPVPLTAQDYARFAGLTFAGASTLFRLLRARQALAEKADGPFSDALNQALDELGAEWGISL